MSYLNEDEFDIFFPDFCVCDFESLLANATSTIDLYTKYYYHCHSFNDDVPLRKKLVKLAIAHQIKYLSDSGITSAEDRTALGSVSIGRTKIDYNSAHSGSSVRAKYNLSLDAENFLKQAGFGYLGVCYDR